MAFNFFCEINFETIARRKIFYLIFYIPCIDGAQRKACGQLLFLATLLSSHY